MTRLPTESGSCPRSPGRKFLESMRARLPTTDWSSGRAPLDGVVEAGTPGPRRPASRQPPGRPTGPRRRPRTPGPIDTGSTRGCRGPRSAAASPGAPHPEPHRGVRIDGPIERYSAIPSMNHSGSRWGRSACRRGSGNVELERVDQLVSDHVIGVGERAGEGQHDAAADRLGHSARAFADVAANRVGLLEIGCDA